ncbi:HAMP domain-containing sensor histidine kinase [Streptomyces sp. NPDC005969]|uniref:sensor histidine kinase n=1 Tax=Streptomyces sp. NPDC005969 TaxID=3156722 RepID=UPI0033E702DE
MPVIARLTSRIARPYLPRRTVRLRMTLLYGVLFLVSGATLLAATYFLVRHAVSGAPAEGYAFAPGGGVKPPGGAEGPFVSPGGHGGGRQGALDVLSAQQQQALEDQKSEVMHQLLVQSGVALTLMSVISVVLGWVVAGRMLRPLRTITATARDISATSLHQRLALEGPGDELTELGDTFDGLLGRLEDSFQAQRQFVANASHELRTPLARQRALGQVALADPDATVDSLRRAHERILVAGRQQERLIEALLTLTRGSAGIDVREPFDLARLTHEVIDARWDEAKYRNITLHPSISPAMAAGHRNLAERLVTNLVDNALRHNVPLGRIDVATWTADGHATLVVTNTGPVVPPAAVDRLFQPFQRLGGTREARAEGLGLGLSIVQAIAHAHDATISTRARCEGGLSITVTFPVMNSRRRPAADRPDQAVAPVR